MPHFKLLLHIIFNEIQCFGITGRHLVAGQRFFTILLLFFLNYKK